LASLLLLLWIHIIFLHEPAASLDLRTNPLTLRPDAPLLIVHAIASFGPRMARAENALAEELR
jgi:hypothetical protein